ncbi:putative tRNA adenosine deaminase-associated protein [Frankia torreyi]|uniref:Putative tRNA adenosine deaminase-associated protein n=1 Tax=Frankia torreyi TaxID=1856 RepID=A0A0D8B6S9_9ACTN|nr:MULTISPECIES: tRNA adenosine deaminase-associated protein [Frankia]KJE19993.1 putative tRNA adenosine deaminase-associated protein [Frankia torreyi]KQC37013.1 tRNA adenosine deaminase [Frankia sp. ACN1ag]KQM02269.1 putative tRNA adenosine deaminase-associated protein [Frankia sp. CpI1-P]
MTTKAIAIARDHGRWSVHDLDPAGAEDLDALTDTMRDFGDDTIVAFLEEDDEYLAIVRLGADEPDPKVFLSDRRVLITSELAERLFADALPSMAGLATEDDEDDDTSALTQAAPVGDLDLLVDLGTSEEALLELIGEEGMLPADLISALSERAGAGEILDDARG